MGLFMFAFGLSCLVILIVALVGKHLMAGEKDLHGFPIRISLVEAPVIVLVNFLVAFLTIIVWGPNMAQAEAASGYKELWGGTVVEAWVEDIKCSRDGPCVHEYECDHYWVKVVDRAAYTDKDGVSHPELSHEEQRHHDCPEVTVEYSFHLRDIFDDKHTVKSHIYSDSPQPWRGGHGISESVDRGVPSEWQHHKDRLENDDAAPLKKINTYTNYILPSEGSLYEKYDGSVEGYLGKGLLPKHTGNLDGDVLQGVPPQSENMQFVKLSVKDRAVWNERLMRFNAALGMELEGDLHIVAIKASLISNPDDYANALKAYWQSALGKWGFAKNGIAVVLGVSDDGKTIEWSRAETGMPGGNGEMLRAIEFGVRDVPFSPDTVLGTVRAAVSKKGDDYEVKYDHGEGLLADIMLREHPFKRPCMKCEDAEDKGVGYVDLQDSIPVPTSSKVWWVLICLLASIVLSGVLFATNPVHAIMSLIGSGTNGTTPTDDYPYSSYQSERKY